MKHPLTGKGFGGGPSLKFTPQMDQRIRDLAAAGKSVREVAEEFDMTRKMIIGRSYRMRPRPLWSHKSGKSNQHTTKPKRKRKRARGTQPSADVIVRRPSTRAREQALEANHALVEQLAAAEPPSTAVTIFHLKGDQCRYPYGERVPYLFCGAPTPKDEPWCAGHAAICWSRRY